MGGMVTTWNPRLLSLVGSSRSRFSLTTSVASTVSDIAFSVTNVYARADHSLTTDFVDDMMSLVPSIHGAWLVVGDFNLIRHPCEKNNDRFDVGRASVFNSLINAMAWFELPLMDRRFTWSNKRDPPTLERLDRAFFDSNRDSLFPDSALASQPMATSDHFPLVVSVSTPIPSAGLFFIENSWLLDP
ncbi:hypothetical protein D1007_24767 [Hordeum vulgare]|nr:hypothetical protein D1007_24767 [Hordeum vulgare]